MKHDFFTALQWTILMATATMLLISLAKADKASWHRYPHNRMTVASRDYPCGTVVRFTHNGRSVTATVRDWGPAKWTGRKWDLNRAAFVRLAPASRGEITVRARVLSVGKKCRTHRH